MFNDKDPEHMDRGGPGREEQLFKCLGWSKQRFFIWSAAANATLSFNAAQLMRMDGAMQVVPDLRHWERYFYLRDVRRPDTLPWIEIGAHLIKRCYAAGTYTPPREEPVKRVGRPRNPKG